MARNNAQISRAVPGTDRKRTRLNAPATATPVPTLPLTSMMTTQTTAGNKASVKMKLRLQRFRYMLEHAMSRPRASENKMHSKKSLTVNTTDSGLSQGMGHPQRHAGCAFDLHQGHALSKQTLSMSRAAQ